MSECLNRTLRENLDLLDECKNLQAKLDEIRTGQQISSHEKMLYNATKEDFKTYAIGYVKRLFIQMEGQHGTNRDGLAYTSSAPDATVVSIIMHTNVQPSALLTAPFANPMNTSVHSAWLIKIKYVHKCKMCILNKFVT